MDLLQKALQIVGQLQGQQKLLGVGNVGVGPTQSDVAQGITPNSAMNAYLAGQPQNIIPNLKSTLQAQKEYMNTPEGIISMVIAATHGGAPVRSGLVKDKAGSKWGVEMQKLKQASQNVEFAQQLNRQNQINTGLNNNLMPKSNLVANPNNPRQLITSKAAQSMSKGNVANAGLYDTKPSYGMSHRPSKTGGTLDDITKKGEVIPEDVYSHPEWYANMNETSYKQSFEVIRKYKGKPNAEVTIYRTAPKKELNNGDWVTLSKKYAQEEAVREGHPVHSFKVKAKDIQFAGDDINEFGYYPNKPRVAQQPVSDKTVQTAKDMLKK